MEYENTWMMFEDNMTTASKRIEAEHSYISLQIQSHGDNTFYLVIEAGIEAVSVELKSHTIEKACKEADEFSKDYFREKARLLEEIAERI